jgi:PAS domain S-box-containing protein
MEEGRKPYEELLAENGELRERIAVLSRTSGTGLGHGDFIVEAGPMGVAIVLDMRFAYVNPAFVALFGYEDSGQLLGREALQLAAPDSRRPFKEMLARQAAEAGMPSQIEAVAVRADGSEFDVMAHVRTLELPTGTGIIVFASDVTERRGMEREIARSKEETERILAAIQTGVSVYDAHGGVIYWNRRMEEITGVPASAVLGRSIDDMRGRSIQHDPPLETLFRDCMQTGQTLRFTEMPIDSTRVGGTILCSGYVIPTLDGEGAPDGVICTVEDVTELAQAAEAERTCQREREETFRALFERSPVPMWESDYSEIAAELARLRAGGGRSLEERLRDDPDEAVRLASRSRFIRANGTLVDFTGAADVAALEAGLATLRTITRGTVGRMLLAIDAGETEFTAEAEGPALDGRRRCVVLRWSAVGGEPSPYSRVISSIEDITTSRGEREQLAADRAELERAVEERTAELEELNQQLVAATEAKDRFLASMSHELRTPLNAIIGFTGTMLQGRAGTLTEEQQRQLDMVYRSGKQLLALVNDVLDLSRIESGRLEPVMRECNVAELCRDLCSMIRPVAEEKGLEVDLDLGDGPLRLVTDPDRLGQVLLNLLSNAVKFTYVGRVGLSVTTDGDWVDFAVTDTGAGIPANSRFEIFEEFRQLATDGQAKSRGTGLGLAISRRLVDMLGGTIEVESEVGRGSRFVLRLPVVPDRMPDPETEIDA